MAEVSTGRFGFVVLVEAKDRFETECFVMAQEDRWSVIGIPGRAEEATQSESSWTGGLGIMSAEEAGHRASALAGDEAVLAVPGLQKGVSLKRVEANAVRSVPQTRAVKARFEVKPSSSALLSSYYQSKWGKADISEVRTVSTDDGGKSSKLLEQEVRCLSSELAEAKRLSTGPPGGSPRRTAAGRHDRHHIGSPGGTELAQTESSDEEEADDDQVVRMLKKFDYKGKDQTEVPPLSRQRGSSRRHVVTEADTDPGDAEEAAGSEAATRPSSRRASPGRRGRDRPMSEKVWSWRCSSR